MLAAGATFSRGLAQDGQWYSMDSAPRDGTWVELKCTYGAAPWYCLARWTDEMFCFNGRGGRSTFRSSGKSWRKPDGGGPSSETQLQWRPYDGSVKDYVDPTSGAQNSAGYWRGAIAAKYRLAPDSNAEKVSAPLPPSYNRKLAMFVVAGFMGITCAALLFAAFDGFIR